MTDTSAEMNSKINGSSHHEQDSAANMMVTALSTPQLEAKLSNLRQQAQQSVTFDTKIGHVSEWPNFAPHGVRYRCFPPDIPAYALDQLHPLLSLRQRQRRVNA